MVAALEVVHVVEHGRALGRSRGGLSTKVVVTAADEDTAVAVDVVPGQVNDAPLLVPMLDRTLGRVPVVDEIVGDKGFDGDALRRACIDRDVNPNIPLKANRDPACWAWDAEGYRERNRVERLFGKLKQFRRIATRYEKLKVTYLGLLHLTLGFMPSPPDQRQHYLIPFIPPKNRPTTFSISMVQRLVQNERGLLGYKTSIFYISSCRGDPPAGTGAAPCRGAR